MITLQRNYLPENREKGLNTYDNGFNYIIMDLNTYADINTYGIKTHIDILLLLFATSHRRKTKSLFKI